MAGQAAPWPNLSPTTLLFFPLLLIFSVCPPASAGAEEGEALLRFKATLSGPGADLPSWIPGPAPCNVNDTTWDGVICFNSHIWGLQLEGKGLAGRLDIGPLVALRALRTISFMRNDLEGPLPEVGRLGALKAVYLSGNRFSGEIPDATFAGMRSLKKLFLSDNQFTGTIPASIAGLGKMLEVRLDHNRFTGRIPEFSQPGLEIIDVSFNSLEGPIPDRLSKLDPALFQGNPNLCGAPLTVTCAEKGRPKPGLSGWLLALIIIAAVILLLALLALLVVLLRSRDDKVAVMGRPSSKKPHEAAEKLEQGNAPRRHLSSSEVRGSGRRGGKDGDHGRLAFVQEGRGRFELHDLLRASAEVLGSGNFGSSFKAVLSSGPTVVVKRFKEMNSVGREDFCEHMRRLGRLSHPNLLPLLAYYYRKEEKLLITEFIANGSLAHMLHVLANYKK
ncbi:hypothetical protein HPP92_000397 [Vanilla planifolia]|uniref:Protein kinase domain-containing protein n=1 Tax=Vanilla planifolia TaxID=51239 RepID=A0A835S4R9_VANPL|nr:hypothetical protein HPP92_000397 [Vanilla planifolia]